MKPPSAASSLPFSPLSPCRLPPSWRFSRLPENPFSCDNGSRPGSRPGGCSPPPPVLLPGDETPRFYLCGFWHPIKSRHRRGSHSLPLWPSAGSPPNLPSGVQACVGFICFRVQVIPSKDWINRPAPRVSFPLKVGCPSPFVYLSSVAATFSTASFSMFLLRTGIRPKEKKSQLLTFAPPRI